MSTPAATPELTSPTPTPETPPTSLITEQTPAPTPETPPVVTEFVPLTAADLKFAEGATVNETARDEFLGIINNRELTPSQQAQAVVELQGRLSREASEAGSLAWAETQNTWRAETLTAFGDQAKLDAALTDVGGLVNEFGTPELRQVMDLTGAGNNAHVVKFLATIAAQLKEGRPTPVPTPAPTPTSIADRIYNKT